MVNLKFILPSKRSQTPKTQKYCMILLIWLFFWLRWVFVAVQGFFFYNCGEWRLLPSCDAWASHGSGLFCCKAWAPGHTGFRSCSTWAQQLWFTGLVAPWHVGSSRTGLQPMSPALAGGCPSTVPPGKSSYDILKKAKLKICVLVSYFCYKNLTQIYSLTILEARNLKSVSLG